MISSYLAILTIQLLAIESERETEKKDPDWTGRIEAVIAVMIACVGQSWVKSLASLGLFSFLLSSLSLFFLTSHEEMDNLEIECCSKLLGFRIFETNGNIKFKDD